MTQEKKQYAISIMPTVLYNTEDIFSAYKIEENKLMARDKSKLVREVEAQTLPGTVWEINRTIKVNGIDVYEAQTPEYWNTPENFYFYIDSRAVKLVDKKPSPRKLTLPSKEYLVKKLYDIKAQSERDLIPYVWGGNILEGVPENKEFYAKNQDLSSLIPTDKKQFFLQGLDCTGLLYYITNGSTPRNSSWWRTFGEGLKIENKNIDEVIAMLKPLDVIVHRGHVFTVLNKDLTIESRLSKGGGVVTTPIRARFEEVFETKVPLNFAPQGESENSWFVIRRFVK